MESKLRVQAGWRVALCADQIVWNAVANVGNRSVCTKFGAKFELFLPLRDGRPNEVICIFGLKFQQFWILCCTSHPQNQLESMIDLIGDETSHPFAPTTNTTIEVFGLPNAHHHHRLIAIFSGGARKNPERQI